MDFNLRKILSNPSFVILILLIISLIILFPVIDVLFLGIMLAYGIRPLALRIKNKLKYSSISILLSIIIVIIPLIFLLIYIFYASFGISSDFLNSNYQLLTFNLNNLTQQVPISETQFMGSINEIITKTIQQISTWIVNYVIKLLKSIPFLTVQLFILFASIYYFVKDGDKCYNFLESLIPEDNKEFFYLLSNEIENVLKSIFYGHFLTSVILGIIAAIGYFILGYDYAIFLGVSTGILQFIPIIGPWPVYWALAFSDFFGGNYFRIIFVLIFGFGISLSDMYIRPALSAHYADIPPLILLLGFIAGPIAYGIVGFILGPLLLGIFYAVLKTVRMEINS